MKASVIALLLFLFHTNAFCCTCIGETSVKAEIKYSDVVFSGKVLSIDTFIIRDSIWHVSIHRIRCKIQVDTLFKGKINSSTIEIVTGFGKGDCGSYFQIGKSYVIYANYQTRYLANGGDKVSPFLYTDDCKRTRLKSTEEMNEIMKFRKPRRAMH